VLLCISRFVGCRCMMHDARLDRVRMSSCLVSALPRCHVQLVAQTAGSVGRLCPLAPQHSLFTNATSGRKKTRRVEIAKALMNGRSFENTSVPPTSRKASSTMTWSQSVDRILPEPCFALSECSVGEPGVSWRPAAVVVITARLVSRRRRPGSWAYNRVV
jgi:hypothetical protein